MKLRSLVVVGLVALPASPALASAAHAEALTLVAGAGVAERASAGSPWTPARAELHPGWEVRCPEGCTLGLPTGGAVHLEAGARIRDRVAVFASVGAAAAERALGLELRAGAIRVDLASSARPLVLSNRDGAEILIPAGGAGGGIDRPGGARFGATLAEAHVRPPRGRWRPLAAGRSIDVRGPVLDAEQATPKAPTWILSGLNAGPVGLAGPGGTARVGGVWSAIEGSAGYAVEIARDPSFTDVVAARRTDDTMASEALAPGKYFARVAALDSAGLAGPTSSVRPLRVAAVAVPPGGAADVDSRTLVLPPARALDVGDADGIEFRLGEPSFRAAHAVALAPADKPELLWLRLRGDAMSISSCTIEPRALKAEVEISPRNARWPADPVDVVVRLSDPSHRVDPATIAPRLKAMIEIDDLPLDWSHDGAVWRAHVAPHPILRNTVLRVEAADEHENVLGRGFAEIEPSRVASTEALAAR